jgi:hypothetical protein
MGFIFEEGLLGRSLERNRGQYHDRENGEEGGGGRQEVEVTALNKKELAAGFRIRHTSSATHFSHRFSSFSIPCSL